MKQGIQQTKHSGPTAHQSRAGLLSMQNIRTMATPPETAISRSWLEQAICAGTQYRHNNTLYTVSKVAALKEHLSTKDQALLKFAGSISVPKSRSHWAT